ncbi:RNA polymerase sigma factor [Cohnella lupini]|uniref:RNA polymerase sigma-70 factor (ECF subfamily) n=1 Tax=Cohnella lupini TaxID=1294267 RepID=A0A3D9IT59_9BACL|nr:RNA polymerase sigma factor [Cohnella lupini]RED64908.1 RNA polymerase sigma-70 factor (ECF subfamily) [Cohnella lupini]
MYKVEDVDHDPVSIRDDDRGLERLHAMLRRYCLSLTESAWEAEDLAQETWLKTIHAMPGFDHRNLEAYLLRIARNTWIDQTRRSATLNRILKKERPVSSAADIGSVEIEVIFQALLNHMSQLQLTIFLLRDVFDYSIAETADLLKTTEGAVKAALHRARRMLPAVKNEIESDILSLPANNEDMKTLLRVVALAYDSGNISTLVDLINRSEMEPVMAIGMLHSGYLQASTASPGGFHTYTGYNTNMSLAA